LSESSSFKLALHGKNLDIFLSRSNRRWEYGKTQVH